MDTEAIKRARAGGYRNSDSLLSAVAIDILQELPARVVQIGFVFDDVSAAGHGVDVEGKRASTQRGINDHRIADWRQAKSICDLNCVEKPEAVR